MSVADKNQFGVRSNPVSASTQQCVNIWLLSFVAKQAQPQLCPALQHAVQFSIYLQQ